MHEDKQIHAHNVHVGTSGWTYADWAGRFYPAAVKGSDRLSYYAGRFDTVEVNATFYRLPTQAMIKAWNTRLGPEFHLVLKGSRVVTHFRKLADFREPLASFVERAQELRCLRVVLWQLPPSLHKDLERLEGFLEALPTTFRQAVEFRHESWWHEDTARVLARYRAAFVAVSHTRLPDTLFPTTDFLYVRFHGMGPETYRYDYSRQELEAWAERLAPHLARRSLYAFFNNDYEVNAPRNAELLRDLLGSPPLCAGSSHP